jgi:hypothetical protein
LFDETPFAKNINDHQIRHQDGSICRAGAISLDERSKLRADGERFTGLSHLFELLETRKDHLARTAE